MPRQEDHGKSEQLTNKLAFQNAKRECAEALHQYRSKFHSDADIEKALTEFMTGTPAWRGELLFMLNVAQGHPLDAIYESVGTTGKQVMSLRRRDQELDSALKDYIAAYFEGEAMLPQRAIRPQVIVAALERFAPGWDPAAGQTLTPERMHLIVRTILDSIKRHVAEEEVQKKIGQDIAAVFGSKS